MTDDDDDDDDGDEGVTNTEYRYLTKYPQIFNCYWGNFETDHIYDVSTRRIVENRNNFITEFNIINAAKFPTTKQIQANILSGFKDDVYDINTTYFDHIECYYTLDDKYVLISSPYINIDYPEYDEYVKFYIQRGFKEYNKLYSSTTNTFIMVI